MAIIIPKQRTFNCPQGNFRATFSGTRPDPCYDKGHEEMRTKIYFKVDVPSMPNMDVRVGRTFDETLHPGSKLRKFLEGWLGRQFFIDNAGRAIDLDTLVGREADITVVHINNDTHAQPFCLVTDAYPPGTLPLTEGFSRIAPKSGHVGL